jgi:hypothetical protein
MSIAADEAAAYPVFTRRPAESPARLAVRAAASLGVDGRPVRDTVQGAGTSLEVSGVSTVMDVGGAHGRFVLELMAARPGLRGQVLDLPHAVDRARGEVGCANACSSPSRAFSSRVASSKAFITMPFGFPGGVKSSVATRRSAERASSGK